MDRDGSTGKAIVAVKIDRCWNRHWRLFLFLGAVAMSCITGAMWMSMQRSRSADELLQTDWKDHWAGKQTESASKVVFGANKEGNRPGININEEDESMQEYLNDDRDPDPDDADYYDSDMPDVEKDKRIDREYIDQYQDEMRTAQVNKTPAQKLLDRYHPILREYSLKAEFNNPFKFFPKDEDITFVTSYDNPCWAESVPRFPYANNSYLLVSEQARTLEPMFQAMRKKFAHQEPLSRWRMRCLPAFYVMETPPLATPSLFTVLGYHPLIATPQLSEAEYWNHKGPSGVASFRDYLDLFDAAAQEIRENVTRVVNDDGTKSLRHQKLTGDGTSSYLWTFDSWRKVNGNEMETEPKITAADIMFKLTPLAKFIFVLRNPTERLFNGYLARSESPSASDFHDKAGLAMEKITKCKETRSVRSCLYDGQLNKGLPVRLRIGMYYPFIADWMRVFPAEQIKVIRYEDYVQSPSQVINEVCKFLEIPPFPTKDVELVEQRVQQTEAKRKASQKVKMLSTTRAMLKEFHRLLNQELAVLLDDEKFNWPELGTPYEPSPDSSSEPAQPTAEENDRRRKKEEEFQEKKRNIQAVIHERREKMLVEQRAKVAQFREKMRMWAANQRERRRKQEEEQQQGGGANVINQPVVQQPEVQQTGDKRPGEQRQGEQQRGSQQLGEQRPGEQRQGDQRPGEQRQGDQRPGESIQQMEEKRRRMTDEQRDRLRSAMNQQQQQQQQQQQVNEQGEGKGIGGEGRFRYGNGRRLGMKWTPGQPPMGQPPQNNPADVRISAEARKADGAGAGNASGSKK